MKKYGKEYRLELEDYLNILPGNTKQIAIALFNKYGVDYSMDTIYNTLSRYKRKGYVGYDKITRQYFEKGGNHGRARKKEKKSN